MSNNMGRVTSKGAADGHGFSVGCESSGAVIGKKCLWCGEVKPASHISHPECSKEIQLEKQAELIADRINGYIL